MEDTVHGCGKSPSGSDPRAHPRRRRALLIAATLLAGSVEAHAQFPDLADASAQYMPPVALEDPRPAKVQVTSYDASLNAPLPLGERTFLIPGLAYHVDSVSFSDTPAGFIELRAFHSVELPVLFVQLLPAGWALSFRIAPGLAGDMEAVDSGLFRLSALSLVTYSPSDSLVVGGGGIVNYAFGSLLPLPAAYLEYKPTSYFSVETFLPAFATAKFKLGDRIELGARAEVSGNAYAVRASSIADAWPCRAGVDDTATAVNEAVAVPRECMDHVAYSTASAGVVAGVRMVGSAWLSAFMGHSFFRRFEQMNADDRRISGGVQSLPNAPLVRLAATWRIPRE